MEEFAAATVTQRPGYRWIVLIAATLTLAVVAGILYSYGIFFKPLAAEFAHSRAAIAGVYSAFVIFHGLFGIVAAWLADRFSAPRIMAAAGFLCGLGLLLSSRINELWQLYLSFSLIVGIGVSAAFPVCTATTARWFSKRRGLALGVVAGGIGIGTLLFVPVAERLVTSFGWSKAYMIIGISAAAMLIPCGILLKEKQPGAGSATSAEDNAGARPTDAAGNDGTSCELRHGYRH